MFACDNCQSMFMNLSRFGCMSVAGSGGDNNGSSGHGKLMKATVRGVLVEAGEDVKAVNANYHVLRSVDVTPVYRPKINIKQSSRIVLCLATSSDEKRPELLYPDVVVAAVLRHHRCSEGRNAARTHYLMICSDNSHWCTIWRRRNDVRFVDVLDCHRNVMCRWWT